MYTVFIDVPFARRGDRKACVTGEWAIALKLLRDSFGGRFGPLRVASPEVLTDDPSAFDQAPADLDEREDDIHFFSLGAKFTRAVDYWRHRTDIEARCAAAVAEATVVHAGINDAFRPWAPTGARLAFKAGKPSVFVIDTDIVRQNRQLSRDKPLPVRLKQMIYRRVHHRQAQRGVREATIALLKGQALMDVYAGGIDHARSFYNTSYSAADVVQQGELDRRLSLRRLGASTSPLRVVSLGRLTARKGVDHSIRAVHAAVEGGASVTLDIIGDGDERANLEALVAMLGAGDHVHFLGAQPYGPKLLQSLQAYDAFIYTPLGEDTARAYFDALCAGLATVCYDISYTRDLASEARQPRTVPLGDEAAMTRLLNALVNDPDRLEAHRRAAAAAALLNTHEQWYARRAVWTIEAHDRHVAARRC